MDNYIVKSLELHLFFARIMKEHALFLKAGFTPAASSFSKKADFFRKEFESLLGNTAALADGIISRDILCSGELITKFTASAERQTEKLTGIQINGNITAKESNLNPGCRCGSNTNPEMHRRVKALNQRALQLLNGFISFKELILNNVLNCEIFTANYPLLLEHIIREAKLYCEYVKALEENGCLTDNSMQDTEAFWNRIMMEHALFIRGLLDPCECELIQTADKFAEDYSELLENCRNAHDKTLTSDALEKTKKFRDFKSAGTQGIAECKIRSLILPLLADHVLREANHYIRLLKD